MRLSEILASVPSTPAPYLQIPGKFCVSCEKLALECGCPMQEASKSPSPATPNSPAPEPGMKLIAIDHDEANELWKRVIEGLDLYATFGIDTDPEVVAGDWWGKLQLGDETTGLVWFTRWIEGDDSVITIGRSLLPEHRFQKQTLTHRGVIYGPLKAAFPGARTALGLIYSTNPASLKATLNSKTSRLAGAIPMGDRTLYLFVLNEWKD